MNGKQISGNYSWPAIFTDKNCRAKPHGGNAALFDHLVTPPAKGRLPCSRMWERRSVSVPDLSKPRLVFYFCSFRNFVFVNEFFSARFEISTLPATEKEVRATREDRWVIFDYIIHVKLSIACHPGQFIFTILD
jgi:hypothetical protein